jgi:hypothetical protein
LKSPNVTPICPYRNAWTPLPKPLTARRSIKTELCTGKFKGYSDIYLVLDNGSSFGIGMYRTPEAKKSATISESVNNTLARYNPEILKEIEVLAVYYKTKAGDIVFVV